MNHDLLTIEATIVVVADGMKISYVLDNRSSVDIYLFDALCRLQQSRLIVDSSLVYAVAENDTLVLFRGVPMIPFGVQVECPEVPFARLVSAGTKVQSTIDIHLPLRSNDPYNWPKKDSTRTFKKFRVRLSYVPVSDMMQSPTSRQVDSQTLFKMTYGSVIDIQKFVETQVENRTIEVHYRP